MKKPECGEESENWDDNTDYKSFMVSSMAGDFVVVPWARQILLSEMITLPFLLKTLEQI